MNTEQIVCDKNGENCSLQVVVTEDYPDLALLGSTIGSYQDYGAAQQAIVQSNLFSGLQLVSNPLPESTPKMEQPLVVDVVSSAPEAKPMALEDLLFAPISTGGGIDFPSARPTSVLDLFNQGLQIAEQYLQPSQSQALQATVPQAGTLTVNATACPVKYTPGGQLVHQHLRKQQVKPRKSPVTQCVTNRHMNSLNPHALKRATRRLNGFMHHVKTAEKAIHKALGRVAGPTHRRTSSRSSRCYQCGRAARQCTC